MAICLNSGINMIIQIVTYILLPLIVAYITTVMTKREEVELDAQGQLLEHRVQAYAEVYRFMRKSLNRIAVPFVEEKLYADCLEGSMYKIGRQGMEYASFLSSIENIDKYSDQLERLLLTNSLYLDSKLEGELNNLQSWIANLQYLLKSFKATEEDSRWKFDAYLRNQRERYACSLLGIALQDDINRFTDNIEPLLEDKLRHPKICKWNFRRTTEGDDNSFEQSQLAMNVPDLIVRLNYLHYSDRYTPNEFDELPEQQRNKYLEEFLTVIHSNLR